MQVGQVYNGKIAPSRGPVRGRAITNVIVRSPTGISRQLALADESQQVKHKPLLKDDFLDQRFALLSKSLS